MVNGIARPVNVRKLLKAPSRMSWTKSKPNRNSTGQNYGESSNFLRRLHIADSFTSSTSISYVTLSWTTTPSWLPAAGSLGYSRISTLETKERAARQMTTGWDEHWLNSSAPRWTAPFEKTIIPQRSCGNGGRSSRLYRRRRLPKSGRLRGLRTTWRERRSGEGSASESGGQSQKKSV